MDWFVYIIQSGDRPKSPIKIGVSSNVDKRVAELQTGNPYPLKVLASITCRSKSDAYGLENFIHKKLRKHRMKGEWFKQGNIDFDNLFSHYHKTTGIIHELNPVSKMNCKDGEIKRLKGIIKGLRKENERLRNDIDEYLDGDISINSIL